MSAFTKAREIISISVGQAGIQLGDQMWRQYCAEHHIGKDGLIEKGYDAKDPGHNCFFEPLENGQYVPRALFCDLESNCIDDIKNGAYNAIFRPDLFVHGIEDAANNFARGHYTIGKQQMTTIEDRLKKLIESCDNCQGFSFVHGAGGGTGSGLGALILEKLMTDHRKKTKLGFHVYTSPNISNCVVEPYNALLTTHWLLDHIDVSLVFDNEALYRISRVNLDVKSPSYGHVNKLIAKAASFMTCSLRFPGELNVDLNEFQTNLVPFPRLHFMTPSLYPIVPRYKVDQFKDSAQEITANVIRPSFFHVQYGDFDGMLDRYMAIFLTYRGNVSSKESNEAVQWIKKKQRVVMVDWVPTGFKIGLNDEPQATLDETDEYEPVAMTKNVAMIANNAAIWRVFRDRICKKYDILYSQRAFVHWYVGEGMEEGEFQEARENLAFLEKDYLDVLNDPEEDRNASEVEKDDLESDE